MTTVYIMTGGPASGKTTVRDANFKGFPVVNPKNILPEVHEWASAESTKAFYAAIAKGESFVYDSTGTNAEKMVTFINAAHTAGFTVEVIYVKCSLSVALARNAARARTVPEYIVREKYAMIAVSFEIVSSYADTVRVISQ